MSLGRTLDDIADYRASRMIRLPTRYLPHLNLIRGAKMFIDGIKDSSEISSFGEYENSQSNEGIEKIRYLANAKFEKSTS